MSEARPSAPRTDPLAAAPAFAIREAVRLEAERMALIVPEDGATVSALTPKPETTAA